MDLFAFVVSFNWVVSDQQSAVRNRERQEVRRNTQKHAETPKQKPLSIRRNTQAKTLAPYRRDAVVYTPAANPPSTRREAPVIHSASSEAKKTAARPMSLGRPKRGKAVFSNASSICSGVR